MIEVLRLALVVVIIAGVWAVERAYTAVRRVAQQIELGARKWLMLKSVCR